MFTPDLLQDAERLLDALRARGLRIATAESCTGGLIIALLTEIAGSSDVVERGFVVYTNTAKTEMLGVSPTTIAEFGAVSEQTARSMAAGALAHSHADLAVVVTGLAGPGGGSADKPVGLVHLAAARRGGAVLHSACRFGDIGRGFIRLAAVREALRLSREMAGIV